MGYFSGSQFHNGFVIVRSDEVGYTLLDYTVVRK